MFSPSLGRVARATVALPSSSCAISSRPAAALTSANYLLTRRTQQRRNSSTSCPPDNSKPSGASHGNASKESGKKAATRSRSKKNATPQVNPPSVPPTNHLQDTDVALSSFFSVHRPISVTTPIPVSSSEATFNSLFDVYTQSKPNKYADVIQTLGNATRGIEGRAQAMEEADLRAEILQNQQGSAPSNRTLSLQEVLSHLPPFKAPPPPVPSSLMQPAKPQAVKAPQEAQQKTIVQKPTKKVWRSTLTLTELTDETGHSTFSAATTPMVRLPTRGSDAIENPAEEITIHQPFLERMEIREQEWRKYLDERAQNKGKTMHAISVKRQRKLKMKKHKYKKLLKRTRNERRRLGQL
ncbi:uncharacterized protein K452DRAFT_359698 [Aplosporella prunicola CBS 121167]|uniref:Small ribosomal subunit protein mS38 n=1 Tax=Aplosporella prunicola CBS 121167 TaxID=1176127 RepID=A0A6A6BDW0_9PEZI|nr:uncharacterized protein K452DRAFT_359698 [Aplosporella prunicola CBS 121167]KAF2140671.1 hypothetical protein K452DRAFT_359698 [Aplosporella prunicola CBS 121167]